MGKGPKSSGEQTGPPAGWGMGDGGREEGEAEGVGCALPPPPEEASLGWGAQTPPKASPPASR